jgi:O-antigen/teichoic acid export membrane protein
MSQFLRKVALALAGQLGQGGASLLLVVVSAQVLDPHDRGAFVALLLVATMSAYILAAGFPGVVLTETARTSEVVPRLLTGATVLAACVGLVGGAVGLGLSKGMELTPWIGPLPFVATFAMCWLVHGSWLSFGMQRFMLGGVIRATPAAAAAVGIAAVAVAGHSSVLAAYGIWTAAHGTAFVICLTMLSRRYGFAIPGRLELRRWRTFGLRFSSVQISQLLTLRLDQFLVAALASVSAVGTYSLAVSLSEAVAIGATAAGIVIFAEAAQGNTGRSVFLRQLCFLVGAGAIMALLLALLSKRLIDVFGSEYSAAGPALQILLIGTPGLVAMRLAINRLAGLDRPGVAACAATLAMAVTVALDVVLIPSMQEVGAAIASVAGYSVGAAAGLFLLLWSVEPKPAVTLEPVRA